MAILLNNVDADTVGDPIVSNGGQIYLVVRGDNYGGGNVQLQVASPNDPDTRWVSHLGNINYNDYNNSRLSIPVGMLIRGVLSGATGASNVFAEVIQA
jgi:hypothetical protein